MKMNKKGFTLVELLAVIAILAILVVMAVPNVLGMFNGAKVSAFVSQAESVYKAAQQQFVADQLKSATASKTYYSGGTKLSINAGTNLQYCVVINSAGKITKFAVADGAYVAYVTKYNGEILLSDLTAGTTNYDNVFTQKAGSSISACANDTGTSGTGLVEPKLDTLKGSAVAK